MDTPQPPKRTSGEGTGGTRRSPSDHGTDDDRSHFVLDEEGTIQQVSNEACELLDLDPGSLSGEQFFDWVHPQERVHVLRELTEIVVLDKQRATWLLRLKTGLGPWQWFRVEVENQLDRSPSTGIVLRLFERGDD